MPTAPAPAQRSRTRAPSMRGARILKSVSRKRSEVGRAATDGGLFSFRPRYLPAIICIIGLLHPEFTTKELLKIDQSPQFVPIFRSLLGQLGIFRSKAMGSSSIRKRWTFRLGYRTISLV